MSIEMILGFMIGAIIGHLLKPKDADLEEQKRIYDSKVIQYETEIAYYKELCKWHVERNKQHGQT